MQYGKKWILILMLGLMFMPFMMGLASAAWEEQQQFHGEVYNPQSGWIRCDEFHGEFRRTSTFTVIEADGEWRIEQGSELITGVSWIEMMIWMVIMWIPVLALGYIIPGYGMPVGMIVMGIVFVVLNVAFLPTFILIAIGCIFILWRGL